MDPLYMRYVRAAEDAHDRAVELRHLAEVVIKHFDDQAQPDNEAAQRGRALIRRLEEADRTLRK